MIYSVSEIGIMMDFLRSNPFVTMEDYKWKLSVPMIRLMSADFTHIEYLSEKEQKMRGAVVVNSAEDLLNDLGAPIFDKSKVLNLEHN
jgi:hypothetical protein